MSICNVPRDAFLAEKPALVFAKPYSLLVKPKKLGTKVGWYGSKPNKLVSVSINGDTLESHVMTSCTVQLSGKGKRSLSEEQFLSHAMEFNVTDVALSAEAHEFETSSIGWYIHLTRKITVRGEDLPVTINFNATLKGSKLDAANGSPPKRPVEVSDDGPSRKRPRHDSPASSGFFRSLGSALQGLYNWFSNSGGDYSPLFFPGPESFEQLLSVLAESKKSLDVCVFMITEDHLAELLIAKHNAGVRVRVISDNAMETAFTTSKISRLEKAGIEVRLDHSKFHMHHKFVVIDGHTCINGSFNWTRPSALGENKENALISRSSVLAPQFSARFENLWNAFANSKGVLNSTAGITSGDVKVLFFPDKNDDNFRVFIDALLSAKKTFDVCVFTLSVREAIEAMEDVHSRGVKVRVITDNQQQVHDRAHVKQLEASGIEVRLDNSSRKVHHKFCVIDGTLVITGSFNWTRQAVDGNYEDCVLLHNRPKIGCMYSAEFQRLWGEYA